MIKKATKKEIRKYLKLGRDYDTVYEVGAFIFNNKVNLYIIYQGQGINEVVYNKRYFAITNLTCFCNSDDYTLDSAVNAAYEEIKMMLDAYYEEHPEERPKERLYNGYTIRRGCFVGGNDDRIDRWYIENPNTSYVDRRGGEYFTKEKAIQDAMQLPNANDVIPYYDRDRY